MAEAHQQLIEFQVEILRGLQNGEDPVKLAENSRNFITGFYGNPPNGAELGLDVNNNCNLRCPHCYYANTHLRTETEENALSEEGWINLIREASSIGIKHFNIVGKEPLKTPQKTKAILNELELLRKRDSSVKYELLTNGTLIQENIDWLCQFPDFYFFNISFDGAKDNHDRIRGLGNYEKSLEGLRLVRDSGIKRLSTTFTAMPHNVGSLDEMLNQLATNGLGYLSVGFCFPTQFNASECVPDENVFYEVVRKLENAPANLDISINLMADEHAGLIAKLVNKGFFRRLAVTEDCAPSLVHILRDKNPRTAVQVSILPIMFYSGFRISYNGKATDFCSEHQSGEIVGFGDIRLTPIEELYKISRQELWPAYTENFFKDLAKSFSNKIK